MGLNWPREHGHIVHGHIVSPPSRQLYLASARFVKYSLSSLVVWLLLQSFSFAASSVGPYIPDLDADFSKIIAVSCTDFLCDLALQLMCT